MSGGGRPRVETSSDAAAGVRLQKLLAHAGVASRRAAETLIREGRVTVDGRPVTELGTRVDPDQQVVRVDGERIAGERRAYYVLNKPAGVVCSAEREEDPRGRPTVVSLLPGVRERLYPVGRLDVQSRGLVLLTNDGDLAARLAHPSHGIPKTYRVKFRGELGDRELARLGAGVTLDDGTRTRPLSGIAVLERTSTNTWVELVLGEGLNRQIRRMGDAIRRPVLKLVRVALGGLTLEGLEEGRYRRLRPDEVAALRREAEGTGASRAPARRRTASTGAKPGPRAPAKPRRRAGSRPPTALARSRVRG